MKYIDLQERMINLHEFSEEHADEYVRISECEKKELRRPKALLKILFVVRYIICFCLALLCCPPSIYIEYLTEVKCLWAWVVWQVFWSIGGFLACIVAELIFEEDVEEITDIYEFKKFELIAKAKS